MNWYSFFIFFYSSPILHKFCLELFDLKDNIFLEPDQPLRNSWSTILWSCCTSHTQDQLLSIHPYYQWNTDQGMSCRGNQGLDLCRSGIYLRPVDSDLRSYRSGCWCWGKGIYAEGSSTILWLRTFLTGICYFSSIFLCFYGEWSQERTLWVHKVRWIWLIPKEIFILCRYLLSLILSIYLICSYDQPNEFLENNFFSFL